MPNILKKNIFLQSIFDTMLRLYELILFVFTKKASELKENLEIVGIPEWIIKTKVTRKFKITENIWRIKRIKDKKFVEKYKKKLRLRKKLFIVEEFEDDFEKIYFPWCFIENKNYDYKKGLKYSKQESNSNEEKTKIKDKYKGGKQINFYKHFEGNEICNLCLFKSISPCKILNDKKKFFVLTDIVNSSLFWSECPNSMYKAVKQHNNLIINLCYQLNGYISRWEGDSFLIVFEHIYDAIKFSLELQYKLLYVNWNDDILKNTYFLKYNNEVIFRGLQVKISICYGYGFRVFIKNRVSFYGPIIDELYKLNNQTVGGEITISECVYKHRYFNNYSDNFYVVRKNRYWENGVISLLHPYLVDRYIVNSAFL